MIELGVKMKKLTTAGIAGLMVAGLFLGGCATATMTSREKLRTMQAETALKRMDKDVSTIGWVDTGLNVFGGDKASQLAKEYKRQLEHLNEDMEEQIRTSSTPEQALREMVEDVTGYMLTELPKDADARGLTEYQINVAMGKLVNKNQDPRLEGALSLIRSNLINNDRFTNRFKLLAASKDRAKEIIDDIRGGDMSVFDNPGGEPVDYIHPDDIYVIEGRTWIGREGYKMHKLTVYTELYAYHPSSNDAFASTIITKNYYYHPAEERFITEADNLSRLQ